MQILPDLPPEFSGVRIDGIEEKITAKARLPAVGTVVDDYGVDEVWFQCRVAEVKKDDKEAPKEPTAPTQHGTVSMPAHATEIELGSQNLAMEAGELKLRPGQQLTVSIRAKDHFQPAAGCRA